MNTASQLTTTITSKNEIKKRYDRANIQNIYIDWHKTLYNQYRKRGSTVYYNKYINNKNKQEKKNKKSQSPNGFVNIGSITITEEMKFL